MPVIGPWALRENNFQVKNYIRFSVEYFKLLWIRHLFLFFIFYIFYFSCTQCFMVLPNVNNALELANQSVHYIGFKHKPHIINDSCNWYFYYRELDRARTSPSFVNLYINSSQCCQNVSGTFISDNLLFSTIPTAQKLTKS